MNNRSIKLYDSTLRDGNHALKQQINATQIVEYAKLAEESGVPYLEIGHGNGLGASSIQVGISPISTNEMLRLARPHLKNTRMSTFMLPGWGTLNDINEAIGDGIDVIRVGTHCTESDLTERYISYLSKKKIEVHGILLMSHMASLNVLSEQALLMESYGASAIGIFDSSGNYIPTEVFTRIQEIKSKITIPIIFHAHNNLGLAIANSIAAIDAGATIIDGCILGFGAGAGNAQLEVLVAVLEKIGHQTGVNLDKILDSADYAKNSLGIISPTINSESIVSGISGVFSGFKNQVLKIADEYKISSREIFYELGKRQAIAGQEDLVIEVAQILRKNKEIKN